MLRGLSQLSVLCKLESDETESPIPCGCRFFSSYQRASSGWNYVFGNFAQQSLPLIDQVILTIQRVNSTTIDTVTVSVLNKEKKRKRANPTYRSHIVLNSELLARTSQTAPPSAPRTVLLLPAQTESTCTQTQRLRLLQMTPSVLTDRSQSSNNNLSKLKPKLLARIPSMFSSTLPSLLTSRFPRRLSRRAPRFLAAAALRSSIFFQEIRRACWPWGAFPIPVLIRSCEIC